MPAAVWRDDDVERLARAALDLKRAMGCSGSAKFSTGSGSIIRATVNADDSSFTKSQLQSKLQSLKQKFTVFKAMKSNSGSGWDPLTGCSNLSDPARVGYVKAHPGAKESQSCLLALYEELREIFDDSVATGRLAVWSRGKPRAAEGEHESNLASDEYPSRSCSARREVARAHSHGSGGAVADTTEDDAQDIAVAANIPVSATLDGVVLVHSASERGSL